MEVGYHSSEVLFGTVVSDSRNSFLTKGEGGGRTAGCSEGYLYSFVHGETTS